MKLIIIYQLKSDEQIVTNLSTLLSELYHTVEICKLKQDQNPISLIQEFDLNTVDRIVLFSVEKSVSKLLNFLMDRRALIVLNNKKILSEYAKEGLIADENYTFILKHDLEFSSNKSESIFKYSSDKELIKQLIKIKFADNKIAFNRLNLFDPMFYQVIAYRIKVAYTKLIRNYTKK